MKKGAQEQTRMSYNAEFLFKSTLDPEFFIMHAINLSRDPKSMSRVLDTVTNLAMADAGRLRTSESGLQLQTGYPFQLASYIDYIYDAGPWSILLTLLGFDAEKLDKNPRAEIVLLLLGLGLTNPAARRVKNGLRRHDFEFTVGDDDSAILEVLEEEDEME